MRKVVLYELMTLDGAVDDPSAYFWGAPTEGGPPAYDDVMEAFLLEVIGAQDVVLLGRHMYEEWSRYWPKVDPAEVPFAGFINPVKKYVVTSTPLSTNWPNAEAVSWPIEGLIADLKAQPGGDIGVHGSITLAQSMLAAGLIEELQLTVGPVVGHPGRRLFSSVEQPQRFELVSSTTAPSGSLLLTYRTGA
jgi:dihydrofolate reductase